MQYAFCVGQWFELNCRVPRTRFISNVKSKYPKQMQILDCFFSKLFMLDLDYLCIKTNGL